MRPPGTPPVAPLLAQALAAAEGAAAAQTLRRLVALGLDALPAPGSGATLARWQALAAAGACDLSLAKLYEGHTDALAILQELAADALAVPGPPQAGPRLWGVWAAESAQARVRLHADAGGRPCISGTKAWCSGAADVSHALLTAWSAADGSQPQLVAVALPQPGVAVDPQPWQAVGMAGSASASVSFDTVPVALAGGPGDYLRRPGFWQGGAGVAACWHGASVALAQALHRAVQAAGERPHALFQRAALGQADVALCSGAALLREGAAWIDAHPAADAQQVALRLRQAAEANARSVLDLACRALGAAPLCLDAAFARRAADLPVFIRQSHAQRDDAALGGLLCAAPPPPWMP